VEVFKCERKKGVGGGWGWGVPAGQPPNFLFSLSVLLARISTLVFDEGDVKEVRDLSAFCGPLASVLCCARGGS
jgi:hypothetical protein